MEDSLEQFSGLFAQLQDVGLSLGLKIVVVIIIFFVGRLIAKFLRRFVKRALSKTSIDPTIVAFASNSSYYVIDERLTGLYLLLQGKVAIVVRGHGGNPQKILQLSRGKFS